MCDDYNNDLIDDDDDDDDDDDGGGGGGDGGGGDDDDGDDDDDDVFIVSRPIRKCFIHNGKVYRLTVVWFAKLLLFSVIAERE